MALSNSPCVLGAGLPIAPGGSSLVSGPASSTDNAIVRWDGTGGNLVQNSVVTVADTTGAMTFSNTGSFISLAGTTPSTSTGTGTVVVGTNIGLSGNAGGQNYFGGNIRSSGTAGSFLLRAASISAGGPAYAFEGDDDTGAWASASDTYQIVTAGTARATFSTTATTLAGNLTASGTGTHTFGTTNTVTMAAGVLSATGNISSTSATGTLTLGTATEIATLAVSAAGASTLTNKAGQTMTFASGASGAYAFTGTGIATFAGNVALSGATASVTLGAATEIGVFAVTAAGALTITPKSGQLTTIASNATISGTGAQTIGGTGSTTVVNTLGLALNTPSTTTPAITVGSGTGVTVNTASEVRQATYKATFTFAAFSAAAATADKTIATLPAKTRLVALYADVTTVFSGGTVTTATMTTGTSAGGNQLLVSFDVKTATIQRGLADADLGTSINRANAVQGAYTASWSATQIVTARLTVDTTTDQLTQGSITFYLITEALP